MTETATDTTKVTLEDIKKAFMNEWEKTGRYYEDMRKFKTAEAYADREMSFVKIRLDNRDTKYFLAYENSLRPHSVQWADFEFVDRFYGRNLKSLNDDKPRKDKKNRSKLKEITANPLNEKEQNRYNELLEFGHGFRSMEIKKAGRTKEEILEDRREFYDFESRLYDLNKISDLESKINSGKYLLCEIVTS